MSKIEWPLDTPLGEIKAHLHENVKRGCVCPACDQFVKQYRRKLNSGMALTLCRIFNATAITGDWLPVKDYLRKHKMHNGHDWTLLRYWGLLEEKIESEEERNPKQNCSGYWRITLKGIDFALGRTTVDKYILTYNQGYQGKQGEQITIKDALGDKFDYDELMKSKPGELF